MRDSTFAVSLISKLCKQTFGPLSPRGPDEPGLPSSPCVTVKETLKEATYKPKTEWAL